MKHKEEKVTLALVLSHYKNTSLIKGRKNRKVKLLGWTGYVKTYISVMIAIWNTSIWKVQALWWEKLMSEFDKR